MLPINYNNNYTPPSSPPSSPCSLNMITSSPASSPKLEPFCLDSDPEDEYEMLAPPPRARIRTAIDPLSGSYNAKRVKRTSRSVTDWEPSKKSRAEPTPSLVSPTPSKISPETGIKREIGTWERALSKVFDSGDRDIDLNGHNLTSIPPQLISDLSKFVTLPNDNARPLDDTYAGSSARSATTTTGRRGQFARTCTAPVTSLAGLPRIARDGKSLSSSLLGAPRDGLDVYLSGNRIRSLPRELWGLHNLRVLSLRNNEISYLPPEISLLKNLVTLNIAHNKLKFVPAELMQMKKLTTLNLFPNPFIPPPSAGIIVSETRRKGSRVPTLVETTLRILLTRPFANGTDVPKTRLEQMYELPLPTGNVWRPISAHLCHTLAVCVPGSIVDESPESSEEDPEFHGVTGVSICPNPAHGSEKSIFVYHSEERYTWENKFPGIEYLGGHATVRWRGCQHGCLQFLDLEDETPGKDVAVLEDEPMEVDEQVVQIVSFEGGALEFD